jgi:transposase
MNHKFTNKKYFIGIDISKDTLDVAILNEDSYGSYQDLVVENSFSGFDKIQSRLTKQKIDLKDCLFCMEHTGTYGLLFFAWLDQMQIDYCVEAGTQIKKSIGMARGKNDRVDARRIADYAYTNRMKLKPFQLPSAIILQIKQLLTYRRQLIKIRTSLKNSLKSHNQYEKVSGLKSISEQIKAQIKEYDIKVDHLEKQIFDVISTDEELKKNYQLAKSVRGIGPITTAFMIVTTNNFTAFENGRKYACYSGIAPFDNLSGTSIKGKSQVSNLANKRIKTLLTNGANSACVWDPEIRNYYKKKISEGKEHNLVINSIRCKLVNRVFAVIKRQSPYVNIYQQNFN